MRFFLFCGLVISGAIVLGGCTDKGQAAQDRLKTLKKPGWVRVINLSTAPIGGTVNQMRYDGLVRGTASQFFPVGEGPRDIQVGTVKVPVKVDSEGTFTIVLKADKSTVIISGEPRDGKDGSPQAVVLNMDKADATLSVDGKPVGDAVSSEKLGAVATIPVTSKKLGGMVSGKEIGSSAVTLDPRDAYTVLVYGGEFTVIKNSPVRQPSKGTPSAA